MAEILMEILLGTLTAALTALVINAAKRADRLLRA